MIRALTTLLACTTAVNAFLVNPAPRLVQRQTLSRCRGAAVDMQKDIVDTAVEAGTFQTLAAALTKAGLIDTLKGPGPFTVFAPTDEAFSKIPKDTLDAILADESKLTSILTYHVVSGSVTAADVVKLPSAKTVQGSDVKITAVANGVKINDANVVATDIKTSNGIIHVIDSVIVPSAAPNPVASSSKSTGADPKSLASHEPTYLPTTQINQPTYQPTYLPTNTDSVIIPPAAPTPAAPTPAAPTPAASSSKPTDADPKSLASREVMEAGATAPFGYFDPLGLSKGKSIKELKKYRESELKHGRIAMLATVGIVVQEFFSPFYNPEFGSQDPGPAAFHFQKLQAVNPFLFVFLVMIVATMESFTISKGWDSREETVGTPIAGMKDSYLTGDFEFDPLGFAPRQDQEAFLTARSKELNNGRLAMIAWWGMVVQELVTNHKLFGGETA